VDSLYHQLRERLERSPGKPFPFALPGIVLRESAVLVPLFVRGGEPHVLVTRRPETLRTHAGQISFPGGSRDPEDDTPLHTALRETHEELGMPPDRVRVLGMLDEVPTLTGYRIIPFVGAIPADARYQPSADEIAEVIEVPLWHLMDPKRRRIEKRTALGREFDVYFYDYGEHVIWGATAHILTNLLQLAGDLLGAQKTQSP
jgi:8-oxo-dGTP pyrophosphatase MutT (NUDIX family)